MNATETFEQKKHSAAFSPDRVPPPQALSSKEQLRGREDKCPPLRCRLAAGPSGPTVAFVDLVRKVALAKEVYILIQSGASNTPTTKQHLEYIK